MQVNIHEAKTQLSQLIQRVLNGEEVIIARNNQPIVRLEPVTNKPAKRNLGALRGLVKSIDDDFDASPDDFKDYMT